MGAVAAWLSENWFSLVQSAGIVGGLAFAGVSARRDGRSRRTGNLLAFTSQHRELWSEFHRRADLTRILEPEVDLVGGPMTNAEEEFLNTVFVHVQTGWELARSDRLMNLKVLANDMRDFLSYPLPRLAWERRRKVRDQHFVRFMDGCLPKSDQP